MQDHPRPYGFGVVFPDGKADATSHATRDHSPILIAIKPEAFDVGGRDGIARLSEIHARLLAGQGEI